MAIEVPLVGEVERSLHILPAEGGPVEEGAATRQSWRPRAHTGSRPGAGSNPVARSDRLDRHVVSAEEGLDLGPGEDARRGADGADATGADGAGELQAFELGEAVEQADDVTGVEGVTAAGAVDERDGVGAQPDPKR